jgi:hypothetical protein
MIIRDESNRESAARFINGLSMEKPWEITVKPYEKKRNNGQNALYWKLCTLIGSEIGYSKDEMDTILTRKFLAPSIVEYEGMTIEKYSTSHLKVAEFSTFLEQIHAFAASDLGITLPAWEYK